MNNPWTTLLAGLREGDLPTKRQAAESLRALGPEAGPVAAAILPLLVESDETVRESLVSVLEDCGPAPATDLKAIAAHLASTTESTAYWAATLLGRAQVDAAFAADSLASELADEARPMSVRERCAWALGEIGELSNQARETLGKCAQSKTPRLARLAKAALGE